MVMEELKLALAILSGRKVPNGHFLEWEEYELLGFIRYEQDYYGRPDLNDVRQRAEEIIFGYLTTLEKVSHEHGETRTGS